MEEVESISITKYTKYPMKMKLLGLILALLLVTTLTACINEDSERITADDLDLEPTPTPTGPPLFSFVVLGDNGSLNPAFATIIAEAEDGEADFVLHAGDITDGKSFAEMEAAKEFMDENLSKPYYVTIGDNDHIVDSSGKRTDAAFQQVFGDTLQSFDYENSHFAILNSTDETNSFSDAELDWLEKDLAASDKEFNFILMHVPVNIPMAESLLGEQSAQAQRQNERFADIIAKYNVDQIYAGHFHGYLNYEIGEIPVTVTGGAGSSPQFGFEEDYHYILVTVYGDGIVNKYQPIESLSVN